MATCAYCHEPLVWVKGRGYAHPGGTYLQFCPACHQEFTAHPPALRCPYCGAGGVRDKHCARPDLSERQGRRAAWA
mgnify:CR=1 FL=1